MPLAYPRCPDFLKVTGPLLQGSAQRAEVMAQAELRRWGMSMTLRYKVPGDPSRGRGYSPRMEHAIDYKSVLDCGIHQDWRPDS